MVTVIVIALAVVALYYFFSSKKEASSLPQIVFNSPQVANKNEKVIEIVKAKLEAVEQAKAESEAMQLLSEILPNAKESIAAKASK